MYQNNLSHGREVNYHPFRWLILFITFILFVIVAGFIGLIEGGGYLYKKLENDGSKSSEIMFGSDSKKITSEESAVIDIVRKGSQAVVSIVATAEVPRYGRCNPGENETAEIELVPGICQIGTETEEISAGSGFIISPDGYIMTNKHVVENKTAEYMVTINVDGQKGKKVKGKVLARDPGEDVAILKIDINNLPSLEFGDSSTLQVGQTTIAIGYSLGEFDNTVSKGVVSGLQRSVNATGNNRVERLDGLIQTDAAINPGNSGGPLLDINGKVIGMNVAMAEAQSIGFAIPTGPLQEMVKRIESGEFE